MIMIKNLYSTRTGGGPTTPIAPSTKSCPPPPCTRTIKYSKALHIKLQLKKIPKKLILTIIIIKKFHALQKSKKSNSIQT